MLDVDLKTLKVSTYVFQFNLANLSNYKVFMFSFFPLVRCNVSNKSLKLIFTAQKKLWEGTVFTPVCDSVHKEGGVPLEQTPPLADTHPPADRR